MVLCFFVDILIAFISAEAFLPIYMITLSVNKRRMLLPASSAKYGSAPRSSRYSSGCSPKPVSMLSASTTINKANLPSTSLASMSASRSSSRETTSRHVYSLHGGRSRPICSLVLDQRQNRVGTVQSLSFRPNVKT
jgi:hypothetical protein